MADGVNKHVDTATIGACLAVGLGIYILIVISAYYSQASIIFQSGGLTARPPTAFPIEQVSFETTDGVRLNGWWLATTAPRGTVLYFQGNRRSPSEYRQRLKTFTALGVNALIFDYRGYGQSPGRIREEDDIYRDGLAAWSYLCHQRGIAPGKLVLWGRSLGGAVAAEVACRRPAGALVLESTFNSLADM
nr:alpha/beta hydrolase [Desulfobacterales bacterium]